MFYEVLPTAYLSCETTLVDTFMIDQLENLALRLMNK